MKSVGTSGLDEPGAGEDSVSSGRRRKEKMNGDMSVLEKDRGRVER